MPINLTCSTYIYRRLSFGVPLEDVFPPGEIHPGLKSLFTQSYENVVSKNYSVEELLSCYQGSLHERLALKEKVVLCREIRDFKAPPGALLWVIRHFIGLLPIELMARRIGDQKYFWWKITKECKKRLSNYATTGRNDNELIHKLSSEILRLPSHNFLLLATLLNFLRMLAVLPIGEPRVNKYAVFALVKYFSSCVFIRPFRPGCATKIDKHFYPLMLYLILKWPEIRRICIETSSYSFELPLDEIYPGISVKSIESGYPHYFSKRCSDGTTQTSAVNSKLEEEEALIRIVPRSYDDFSFLRDTACQTEAENKLAQNLEMTSNKENNRKSCCCCLLGSHYERSPRKEWSSESSIGTTSKIENKVIFMRKECCCTYSTNYETNLVASQSHKPKSDTFNVKKYGWNIEEGASNNLGAGETGYDKDISNLRFSPSDFTESSGLGYGDDSNIHSLMYDSDSDEASYCLVNTLDPIPKDQKMAQNEALKEHTSKMGFGSRPDDAKSTGPNMESYHPIGWNIPHDYQNLYLELRQSLNQELKKKLSKMKLKPLCDENQITSDNGEDVKSSCENSEKNSKLSAKEATESKRSLLNINKIKSSLDFLRIFKANKKSKPKKSCSYEQVSSGFKYEKLGSASSLL